MSLIFAIILGVILFAKVCNDKSAVDGYKKERMEEVAQKEMWLERTVDVSLEDYLRRMIDDPSKKEDVAQEINAALSEMGESVPYVTKDEKLDIMLANRGKIRVAVEQCGEWTASLYHTASGKNGVTVYDSKNEDRKNVLMRWIQATLKKNGLSMELWRCAGRYYWEGSTGFEGHILDLNRFSGEGIDSPVFCQVGEWNTKKTRPSM